MRMFHATDPKNVESILENGVKTFFGEVYLSDSAEGAARWKSFFMDEVAVIEVEVDGRKLHPGCDHSPILLQITGAGPSYVTRSPIPPDRIHAVLNFKRTPLNK